MQEGRAHCEGLPQPIDLPADPPFFQRSSLTSFQSSQVSNLVSITLQSETQLGPFTAGSVDTAALEALLDTPPFADEVELVRQAVNEAQGHQPPWLDGPPPTVDTWVYRTPECFSEQEVEALDKDLEEGLLNGTYKEVQEHEVALCLARRPILQGNKYRIIDNARPINQLMNEDTCSVRYEDLRWARAIAAPYMSKIDLKKGYRQIALNPDAKPFFCFIWRGKIYQFQVIAFGDASAPRGFTTFMRGFALRWRTMGITCLIYLDDILITALTFDKWRRSMETVLADLAHCRVRIGVDKLFIGPFSCLEFLGVFIDAANSRLFVSATRTQRITSACNELLNQEEVAVRDVQALLGHLSFVSVALVGLSLYRRSLDLWVARHDKEEVATLSDEARDELEFFLTALPRWAERSFKMLPFSNLMMVTDASETAWGGILLQGGRIIYATHDKLPATMIGASSTAREMHALVSFAKLCVATWNLGHCRVQAQVDNKGCGTCINKGKAKANQCIPLLREMLSLQLEHELAVIVDWRERSDSVISLVDALSKLPPPYEANLVSQVLATTLKGQEPPKEPQHGSAEWGLEKPLFQSLCDWAWNDRHLPQIDLFATEKNRQVPAFCSRYFSPHSLGNAFAVDWSHRRLYAFPPFSQLSEVIVKIRETRNATILLITKFDRSDPIWPLLLSLSPTKRKSIPRHNIVLCLDGRPKGHPSFDLVALLFTR